MSTALYKATLELAALTSCTGRTLREAWLYATGLKRLQNRYGSEARLPDGVVGTAGGGLIAASVISCFGGIFGLAGAVVGDAELASGGVAVLVYGAGPSLAFSFGTLNAYSHWKAGQYDYRLEQTERAAALPAPSARRALVLK